MEPLRSTARDVGVALGLALALAACDRGCGRAGRDAPTRGGAAPGGSTTAGFDLTGTDCSDGLVRCVEGRVEASRLATLPYPCGTMREGRNECVCPWDPVAICAHGCAAEGLVAHGDADAGKQQLCAPSPAELGAVVRPPLPGDPAVAMPRICSTEGIACIDGAVRICDRPGVAERVVATCVAGCESGIGIDHGDRMIGDGAAPILCRRAHAERQ